MQITPAILAYSQEEINNKIKIVAPLLHRVQIDICDGKFGLEKTWIPEDSKGVAFPKIISYEYDIMVNDWRNVLEQVVSLGASRIVLHADVFSNDDFLYLKNFISEKNIDIGVSVSNDIPVDQHIEIIKKVRTICPHIFIQVMGIVNIGASGQFFDENCINRIKTLRSIFPDISIQVDGGMHKETIPKVAEVGADTIVVGSYFFSSENASMRLEEIENMSVSN